MLEKCKGYVNRNYFGEEFSLGYKTYMIFLIISVFLSLVSTIFNTLYYDNVICNALQWMYTLFCIYILFAKPSIRMKVQKPQLVIGTMIYIPFVYFLTGGYDGTALLFAGLGPYVLVNTFSGKSRVFVIFCDIMVYLSCIGVNYYFPNLIIPIESVESKVSDLVVSMILVIAGGAIMAAQTVNAYQKQNEKLAELSVRDALTGTYNRGFLLNYLKRSFLSGENTGKQSAMLMLDIDFFKKINDTYGHVAGDAALCEFTKAVQSSLRDSDILARYGGEEFVAILQNVNLSMAKTIAERIRCKVSEIQHAQGFQTTVSIGLALCREGVAPEKVLTKADECLYKAKENGRNQVYTAD